MAALANATNPTPAEALKAARRLIVKIGSALLVAESGEIPIKPGDIVLIPPNERHMTRNTGTEPLVLLCFFAEPDVSKGTTEFKSF